MGIIDPFLRTYFNNLHNPIKSYLKCLKQCASEVEIYKIWANLDYLLLFFTFAKLK